ncbi:hypothetical protein [Comamonas thiooxydans]|uniref:hypothetical protein n=1 Tax=Comamonas thiooxydans TaxID=363952 RepID=UPI000B4115DA|nr:hypothetical protein [Comamonas thiooxydans]
MSRTIRRTRGNPHELSTWVDTTTLQGNDFHERVVLRPGHDGYKKAYWQVHKDGHKGVYGVPRWYRRDLNREVSREEQRVLLKALRTGELDAVVLNARKNNAGWYWW